MIIRANTGYISYYAGRSLGHYLVLDYINTSTDIITIEDCHYDNKYFGRHENQKCSEVYGSITTYTDGTGSYMMHSSL